MSTDAERLLAELLKLPLPERADVVHRALASLDPADEASPEEVEAAWAEELDRRLAEVDAGAPLESWENVKARLAAQRRGRGG